MLKAKMSSTVRIGEVRAIREYLKETTFEECKIRDIVRSMMKEHEIGLTELLKVELTAYEVESTVVYIIAQGLRYNAPGTQSAFVEIYYEYEKGLHDEKAIVRIYK